MNDPIDFDDDGAGFGKATRRQALKTLALGAVGAPMLGTLLAAGNAAAQSPGSDYKTLVVLFQNGGNDHANTIIPRGSAYGAYQSARPSIAIPENQLLAINPTGHTGPALGFAPQLTNLRTLFESGKAGVVANVGTLVQPVTKAEFNAQSKPLPFQLFSHSDQQRAWETGFANKDSRTGWLGRMGDALGGAYNPNAQVSICMSISGNNVIQAGENTPQFQMNVNGPVRIDELGGLYGSALGGNALRTLLTENRWHLLEASYNGITTRAISSGEIVSNALNAAGPALNTKFPENDVGRQAKMVAHMIRIRQQLGQRRQIFFISTGGWDVHDDLPDTLSRLLGDVDTALSALYQATVEMGVSDSVTIFTASDFGRALQTNGRGSDHGWGGHHFVLGGAVRGKQVYGKFPTIAINGAEDAGQGRLIPTTSTDEYAATLCRWFGADASMLGSIMPNLGAFATPNLGFLG
jgi:uncharacterized protein (DUF1501 family)